MEYFEDGLILQQQQLSSVVYSPFNNVSHPIILSNNHSLTRSQEHLLFRAVYSHSYVSCTFWNYIDQHWKLLLSIHYILPSQLLSPMFIAPLYYKARIWFSVLFNTLEFGKC